MSLPSVAEFILDGDVVETHRVNCGMIYSDASIRRVLVDLADANRIPEKWDSVRLYGITYNRVEANAIIAASRFEKYYHMLTRSEFGKLLLNETLDKMSKKYD